MKKGEKLSKDISLCHSKLLKKDFIINQKSKSVLLELSQLQHKINEILTEFKIKLNEALINCSYEPENVDSVKVKMYTLEKDYVRGYEILIGNSKRRGIASPDDVDGIKAKYDTVFKEKTLEILKGFTEKVKGYDNQKKEYDKILKTAKKDLEKEKLKNDKLRENSEKTEKLYGDLREKFETFEKNLREQQLRDEEANEKLRKMFNDNQQEIDNLKKDMKRSIKDYKKQIDEIQVKKEQFREQMRSEHEAYLRRRQLNSEQDLRLLKQNDEFQEMLKNLEEQQREIKNLLKAGKKKERSCPLM